MGRSKGCGKHGHPKLARPVSAATMRRELARLWRRSGQKGGYRLEWTEELSDEHARNPRRYAQVLLGGPKPIFQLAPEARRLPRQHRRGLLAHEVGHTIVPWETERGADRASEHVLGVQIAYDHRWPGRGLQVALNPRRQVDDPRQGQMFAPKPKGRSFTKQIGVPVMCFSCGQEWPQDPALDAPCPDCQARPGSPCMRPSGHPASSIHRARKAEAFRLGLEPPCPAAGQKPHRARRGPDQPAPTGRRAQQQAAFRAEQARAARHGLLGDALSDDDLGELAEGTLEDELAEERIREEIPKLLGDARRALNEARKRVRGGDVGAAERVEDLEYQVKYLEGITDEDIRREARVRCQFCGADPRSSEWAGIEVEGRRLVVPGCCAAGAQAMLWWLNEAPTEERVRWARAVFGPWLDDGIAYVVGPMGEVERKRKGAWEPVEGEAAEPFSVSYELRVEEIGRERQAEVEAFVREHHAHFPRTGPVMIFGLGVWNGPDLVGVAWIERPKNWRIPVDWLEVNRVAIRRDLPRHLVHGAATKLYSTAWRIAREKFGAPGMVTFTLEGDEVGSSLKASGWEPEYWSKGGEWSREGRERERGGESQKKNKIRWQIRSGRPMRIVEILGEFRTKDKKGRSVPPRDYHVRLEDGSTTCTLAPRFGVTFTWNRGTRREQSDARMLARIEQLPPKKRAKFAAEFQASVATRHPPRHPCELEPPKKKKVKKNPDLPVPGDRLLPAVGSPATLPAGEHVPPVTSFELVATGRTPLVYLPAGAYEYSPATEALAQLLAAPGALASPSAWDDLLSRAGTRAYVYLIDRRGDQWRVLDVIYYPGARDGALRVRHLGPRGDMTVDLRQAYGHVVPVLVYKPPLGR